MSGGDEGTRTPDFRDANAALSQLSYIPKGEALGEGRDVDAGSAVTGVEPNRAVDASVNCVVVA
jgi:hypothetical protein